MSESRLCVFLEDASANKIAVIKVLREHLNLGLKEAKDLAESAPCVVLESDDAVRLERLKEALVKAGATVREDSEDDRL